ncbi:MAG: hypothetical protein JNM10_18190 [Planctomycetia bacterium]|nr:hypothetical protein [Planctomycetia bacterium]
MSRHPRSVGLRRLLLAMLLGGAAAPAGDVGADAEVPLPLTGRLSVKADGKRYVVDGKQVLAAGALIKLEEGVRVVGKNGASLEVKGGLRALGGDDGKVSIDGIDFSPTVAPENGFHLNGVTLSGCTFVHGEGAAFEGELTVENSTWSGAFDVRIARGFARIMSTTLPAASVTCVADKGRAPEVALRGCQLSSFTLKGASAATLRSTSVSGTFTAVDFTDLLVDGCDVSGGLVFRQGPEGSFSKLVLTKCNLEGGATVTFARPAGPKTPMEKVRLDKFWFGRADAKPDLTDQAIGERIQDGADDPAVSVKAYWSSPQERRR